MKRCRFCAEEIQDLAILCRFCNREQAEQRAERDPREERNSFLLYAGTGLAIFCLAVGVAAAATHPAAVRRWAHAVTASFSAAPPAGDASAGVQLPLVAPPPPPPPPPPLIEPVVAETARRIEPDQYLSWSFTLNDSRPCRLKGHVSVIDGGSHDVDVFVVDPDGFANFQNGREYRTYMMERRTSAVTLDLPVDGFQQYHLVVSNRFSVFTGKAVVFENIRGVCDSVAP